VQRKHPPLFGVDLVDRPAHYVVVISIFRVHAPDCSDAENKVTPFLARCALAVH
jgi:hypothetical protein